MQPLQATAASPRLTPRAHLDPATKAHINKLLRDAASRTWALAHGKRLPPPKLPPVVLRVIRQWFELVDDDGSGTLEHHELLAALQAARIPCDESSISEMIQLMDANRDGCISWSEFEAFMMLEFAAGQQLLSGEFVLPSGVALPFGAMIRQLKRSQMMSEVTQGGEARRKWLHVDVDLSADAAEIARAEEAILLQKIYNETLHTHDPARQAAAVQAQQQQARQQQAQQQPLPASSGRPARERAESPPRQQHPLLRPASVPRLQLGAVGIGGVRTSAGAGTSSRRSSRLPSAGPHMAADTEALLGRLPASLAQLLGSPRPDTARLGCSSSARCCSSSGNGSGNGNGNGNSRAPHAQPLATSRRGSSPPPQQQQQPTSARRGASGDGMLRLRGDSSPGHHTLQPQPARDEWRAIAASCLSLQHSPQCSSSGGAGGSLSGSGSRQEQRSTHSGALRVQPPAGPACRVPRLPLGRVAECREGSLASRLHGSGSGSSAPPGCSPAASPRPDFHSVLAASARLRSARAVPPAALLSEAYRGPVEAALTARTSRRGCAAAVTVA